MWVRRYFGIREAVRAGRLPLWLDVLPARKRARAVKLALSCVPWDGNRDAVKRVYREAKRMKLQVDHVIPLSHPYVCGLTVHSNLRLVTGAVNLAKGNKWHPDQEDAWGDEVAPHQLHLPV